mgnify:CR=1 FL=1
MPGKYFNLYSGRLLEPEKVDVSEIIHHFKKVFGEDNWKHLEQYLAYCIKFPGEKGIEPSESDQGQEWSLTSIPESIKEQRKTVEACGCD